MRSDHENRIMPNMRDAGNTDYANYVNGYTLSTVVWRRLLVPNRLLLYTLVHPCRYRAVCYRQTPVLTTTKEEWFRCYCYVCLHSYATSHCCAIQRSRVAHHMLSYAAQKVCPTSNIFYLCILVPSRMRNARNSERSPNHQRALLIGQ